MSKELIIPIEAPADYAPGMARVQAVAGKTAQAGHAFEIALRYPSKTDEQRKKYHAMIGDIRRQCFRGYSYPGVKAVLVKQFAEEMEQAGTPLARPGEKVWDWKTQEPVYVRPSTEDFRKDEAAQFVEFLFSVGAEYGVTWSEKALATYDEYPEAA